MAIHTNEFRGTAQDGVYLQNETGGSALYNKIKEMVTGEIKARRIPANITENYVKSGGLFGEKLPILIITHSDSSCRYFSVGIYVNGNQVFFPLLGESAENTKYNRKQDYEKNGNFIKAALTKPDEFKLQQEAAWRHSVLDCFNSALN